MYVSDEGDEKTIEVLRELGVISPAADDVTVIRYICALVSNRAAKIIVSGKNEWYKRSLYYNPVSYL